MRRIKIKEEKLKRSNRQTLMLNDRELRALNVYCQRFRVKNRSKFLRETLMTAILKRFDEEMPSLFEEAEPNLFREEAR
ncbi:MAG: hypothetical protein E4G95_02110 [Bacteroidia bacterium]|nr:MAG: hypothetical protein E4G95_02110 [Bacteroidia bacterium]